MLFKQTIFVATTLATLAVATPVVDVRRRTDPASSCSTGTLNCCNSSTTAEDKGIAGLLGLLNIVVSDITALVGITCTPITVVGAGGTSCTSQTLCCDNNNFGGLLALGCVPINISL
ncbi:hydrophobin 1 [Pleurotus eryngii]|uniref:Hydrophobin n=1 Tax=Pleurotus eryngii TaxID=5323 RepID=A0A9P6DKS1_PLEER|nr:hydrophobin 1 [Pleurotus eryngii]